MGGCYSTESETATTSSKSKLPSERQFHHTEKGPHYLPLSLTYRDPRHEENDILKQSIIPLSADNNTLSAINAQQLPEDVERVKGVAPSDSGIESIGPSGEECFGEGLDKQEASPCKSCHNKLKRLSSGFCQQCNQLRLGASELTSLLNGNAHCTCSPELARRVATRLTPETKSKASSPNRHSDIPTSRLLKSNLKKLGQEKGDSKHVRMSWKSADSLDLNSTMITCMDRAKSEASDVFGDDVSFRAPLADFDSVSNQLDVMNHVEEEEEEEEGGDKFFTSRMSIYSDILELTESLCLCDFSDIPSEGQNDSLTESVTLSGSNTRQTPVLQSSATESTGQLCSDRWPEKGDDGETGQSTVELSVCDVEGAGRIEGSSQTSSSSSHSHGAANASENQWNDGERGLGPVSLVVKGRHIVLVDAQTYAQLVQDVHILKQRLLQLSQVLQENNEDVAMDSSQ